MPINSLDDFIASSKQILSFTKTQTQSTSAANWSSVFDRAGNPGAGTLRLALKPSTRQRVPPSDLCPYQQCQPQIFQSRNPRQ